MKYLFSIFVSLTLLSVSCYYDSEESLYPGEYLGNCDTTNVTYSSSIFPLLDNNCLSCHSAVSADSKGGGTSLEGYQNVLNNKQACLSAIKHIGDKPMPKNSAKLKDCLIQQFQIWVDAGALEN